MMESKPVDSNIRLIPWVECLSKEGIDFLVWCDDTYVYQLEKLMKPKLLSIRELIEFVKKDPKLYCSIAHPFVPSDTAVLFHYDEETLSKLISKAKVVEKHNYSLYTTRLLFRKFLPWRFKNKLLKIEELPDIFTDGYAYTGWSDAHTIDGIWPYLDIHHSELASIHSAIVDPNISREMVVDMNVTFFQAMSETITSWLIVMYESIKKRCNLYSIDRTYFRS